jgi:serine/threonine protein kinase
MGMRRVAVKMLQMPPEHMATATQSCGGLKAEVPGQHPPAAAATPDAPNEAAAALWKQLEKEVALQAGCRHDNVVTFYAMCYDPPAIIMEYCEGGTLMQKLEDALWDLEPFGWQERLHCLIDAASALWNLHSMGMVHGDLRSPNLLLARAPAASPLKWIAKIADFGFAELLSPQTSTAVAADITNPLWVAPEVLQQVSSDPARSGYEVSPACDVFSYGVVLWEVLTGLLPYSHLEDIGYKPQVSWSGTDRVVFFADIVVESIGPVSLLCLAMSHM